MFFLNGFEVISRVDQYVFVYYLYFFLYIVEAVKLAVMSLRISCHIPYTSPLAPTCKFNSYHYSLNDFQKKIFFSPLSYETFYDVRYR